MLASAQTIKSAGTRHRPLEQRQRFISTMRALCAHTRKCCNRLRAVRGGNSVVSFFQRYLARNELNSDEHTERVEEPELKVELASLLLGLVRVRQLGARRLG